MGAQSLLPVSFTYCDVERLADLVMLGVHRYRDISDFANMVWLACVSCSCPIAIPEAEHRVSAAP